MINPDDPLERQVEKLTKIIDALMVRIDKSAETGAAPYALFQTAIDLESKVQARTEDLQTALDELGETHAELSRALGDAELSRKNLFDALEAMSEGFALFENEALIVCNEKFQNLLPDMSGRIQPGMTFEDYTAVIASSPFLEPDEGQSREDWRELRRRQHGRPHAAFIVRLSGDRWIQVSDRRMTGGRAAILHTDITDLVREQRVRSQELLDRQARLARATIDHMTQGVCTFDATNCLVASNTRFFQLLSLPFSLMREGTALRDMLDFLDLNQVFDRDVADHDFLPWLDCRNGSAQLELEIRRADGRVLDARFRRLPEGGFVGSFTDVTAERLAADALAQANATLEQRVSDRTSELTAANNALLRKTQEQEDIQEALRLAKEQAEAANLSKTRFLAAASHDLLQPLNAAHLFLANLSQTEMDATQRRIVDSLGRSFSSVESLLEALLDISRLDASGAEFNVGPVPLASIFDRLEEEFGQVAASKGLRLRFVPTSLSVVSDRLYLHRIVQNLLSNALKYTPAGRVTVGCRRMGDRVSIQIFDTGIGIAQRDQERVFEEFQRLDMVTPDQGMGLGLSFVKRACDSLGHTLELHSTEGVGSVFTIDVERSRQGLLRVEQPRDTPASPDNADLHVLSVVVENDCDVLAAMTATMERWGVSVIPARSTEDLLAQVAEIGVPPDIIVADYHLIDSDTGLRSVRALRDAVQRNIPAIIVTADRSDELRLAVGRLGAELLNKPLEPAILRSLMAKHLQ